MKFIDRVKKILLDKNQSEILAVEKKIQEAQKKQSENVESIKDLKKEAQKASQEAVEAKNKVITGKELSQLGIIYDFLSNYSMIEMLLKEIMRAKKSFSKYLFKSLFRFSKNKPDDLKYVLYNIISELNKKTVEIDDMDLEGLSLPDPSSTQIKKGQNPQKIFGKFRETITKFKSNYNRFIMVPEVDEHIIIERSTAARILGDIQLFKNVKRNGIELEEENEEFLQTMQPHELWAEILKYYGNIETILKIIDCFESCIDDLEKIYQENPSLFNLENLERIFKENNSLVLDAKIKRSEEKKKYKTLANKREQMPDESKSDVAYFEKKKTELVKRAESIKKAKTLQELGYTDKADAVKKLQISSKDYIVIPIPNTIQSISELFSLETRIKIQFEDNTFYTTYLQEIASGQVNSLEQDSKSDSVLMIPISTLKKEDIDSIKAGKVNLKSSVLQMKDLIAILPHNRQIDFGDSEIEIMRNSSKSITNEVKKFLGDDYVSESSEIHLYEVFKNIPDSSNEKKKKKRDAVKKCLFENVTRDILYTDNIKVDGKKYFFSKVDEQALQSLPTTENLEESKLIEIADEIESFLLEEKRVNAKIDQFYQKLMLEYLRINKKAKAEYYEEKDTKIHIKGKTISIKPPLPTKNSDIIKNYSRRGEDIIYKIAKLASLVNRFAHMTENEELTNKLFGIKLDLIEEAIDLSQNNPNVKIKKQFDEEKMVSSISLEIPGYNMIALHAMNKSASLIEKIRKLENNPNKILQTSTILYPGVNKELIMVLKSLKPEERMQILINLDLNVFQKLVIRMGYTTDKITSSKDRSDFIKKIVSDEKIEQLLKETDELDR